MTIATEREALRTEMTRHIVKFADKRPDWGSFQDSKDNPRAQFRYVGGGGATPDRWALGDFVPAGNFTVSMLYVPPGGGGTMHGHREEEVFFVVEGQLAVAWAREDEVVEIGLGPKDMLFSPPGHLHSYRNKGVEGAYLLIMLGSGRPGPAHFPSEAGKTT